jgi:HEPN domain-containing protein
MVREIKGEEAARYLEKAKIFYSAAVDERDKGRYDVAVFNAAQGIILANDAFCIAILGARPSKDHKEAERLHVQACSGKESKREVVADALDKRSTFGYTEKTANEQEANFVLLRAQRFIEWVKKNTGL